MTTTEITIKDTYPNHPSIGGYTVYDKISIKIEAKDAIEMRAIIDKLEEKIISK